MTQGIGTGTAVPGSDFDFGTITISTLYTREETMVPTPYNTGGGFHGTPCSQSYETIWLEYNANKWFLNHYGSVQSRMGKGV